MKAIEELQAEIEDLKHQLRHRERIERDLRSHLKDQQDRLSAAHEQIGRLKAILSEVRFLVECEKSGHSVLIN